MNDKFGDVLSKWMGGGRNLPDDVLKEVAHLIDLEASKPPGYFPRAFRIWLAGGAHSEDSANASAFFGSGEASQVLEGRYAGIASAARVHRLDPSGPLFHFELRFPSPGDLEVLGVDVKRDLEQRGVHVETLRTRFVLESVSEGETVAGMSVAADGEMLEGCATPCILEGALNREYVLQLTHRDGSVGEARVRLPLSTAPGAEHSGGVVRVEVKQPAPLAGELSFLGFPKGMTILVNGTPATPFSWSRGARVGEPLTIRATHPQFEAVEFKLTPRAAPRIFVPIGMRPVGGLPGASVLFSTQRSPFDGQFKQRVVHPGVTLIRRRIEREEQTFDGIPEAELKVALRQTAQLAGTLGGMDQFLQPQNDWQDLPRSVWFWVVNLREPGTLVDMPDPRAGTPVAVAAYRFADSQPAIWFVSGAEETPVTAVGEPVVRALRQGESLQVMASHHGGRHELFTLLLTRFEVRPMRARIRGTAGGKERHFELEPGGDKLFLDADLDRCGGQPDHEVEIATAWQSPSGAVWFYPSAASRIPGVVLESGIGVVLQQGQKILIEGTEFELI